MMRQRIGLEVELGAGPGSSGVADLGAIGVIEGELAEASGVGDDTHHERAAMRQATPSVQGAWIWVEVGCRSETGCIVADCTGVSDLAFGEGADSNGGTNDPYPLSQ